MLDQLQQVLEWVFEHPNVTLVLLAVSCAGESILVLGALIPTTVVLLVTGGLVAAGALEFWPTVIAATIGAVAGDTINYAVGRVFGPRILQTEFAKKNSMPIDRSLELFKRHGAKALVIGRFFGLVRPFVAAIAGTNRMSAVAFVSIETAAALVWALPQIVVGVAFGASLDLAAEVATRLLVVILALAAFVALTVWLVNLSIVFLADHGERWVKALLDWSHRHRRVGRLGEWLADPSQPETPGLAILALALFAISALWLWVWWGLFAQHPTPVDALAFQTLKALHTPLGLGLAVGIAQLGAWPVYVPVAIAVFLLLLWLKRWRAAWHWAAALAFAGMIVIGLTLLLTLPDPIQYYNGEEATGFSGRELVVATVVYGFLPVLLSTGAGSVARITYYSCGFTLIGLIGLAQAYVGAQWVSVGAFSVVLGGVWTLLLAIGYRRHGAGALHIRRLAPVLGVFAVAATLAWSQTFEDALASATPEEQSRQELRDWWPTGFRALPAYRVDLAGVPKQPLNVQWVGRIEEIEESLIEAGWTAPRPLEWRNMLRWLSRSPLEELPVLPQSHETRNQVLVMRKTVGTDRQVVLRLWPSPWTVSRRPLWIGSVTEQSPAGVRGLLRVPDTLREYNRPMRALQPTPPGFRARQSTAHPGLESREEWSGSVWLIRPEDA